MLLSSCMAAVVARDLFMTINSFAYVCVEPESKASHRKGQQSQSRNHALLNQVSLAAATYLILFQWTNMCSKPVLFRSTSQLASYLPKSGFTASYPIVELS